MSVAGELLLGGVELESVVFHDEPPLDKRVNLADALEHDTGLDPQPGFPQAQSGPRLHMRSGGRVGLVQAQARGGRVPADQQVGDLLLRRVPVIERRVRDADCVELVQAGQGAGDNLGRMNQGEIVDRHRGQRRRPVDVNIGEGSAR